MADRRKSLAGAVRAFADNVMTGAGEAANVALGPIVWDTDPGRATRHWYFMVCRVGAGGDLRIAQFKVAADDERLVEHCRAELMLEMVQRRRSLVIMDFDDELRLARWCEALCPGERSRRIRTSIESEREETR